MAEENTQDDEQLILKNTFTGYRSSKKIEVKLYKTYICADKVSTVAVNKRDAIKNWVIHFKDVIGCHVRKLERKESNVILLYIYCYPLCKSKKVSTRNRYCHKILIDACESEEENKKVAELWRHKIAHYIRNIEPSNDPEEQLPIKNMLVFLNPFGGTGSANKIYKTVAVPMFEEADIKHKLIVTEHAGHAKLYCTNEDLSQYDGIVIAGGDGLIYEIINGIMLRSDWKTCIKIPIGVIPAGSGNALAASVLYSSTGEHFIDDVAVMSVFEICKGFVTDMDIASIEQLTNPNKTQSDNQNNPELTGRNVTFSNLGVIFGFIADVDIGSEKLRFLGQDNRTTIYAILRLVTMRKYHAVLSYLPDHLKSENRVESKNINSNNALESGDHLPSDQNFDNVCLNSPTINSTSSSILTCPPLTAELPDTWITEERGYMQILSCLRSHIAQGKLVCKDLTLSSGSMFLQTTTDKASRKNILDIWERLDYGEGSIVNNKSEEDNIFGPDKVRGVTCTAFRLIPTPKHSQIITVDGELVPFGPLQCEIHKGLARTFCSK